MVRTSVVNEETDVVSRERSFQPRDRIYVLVMVLIN